MSHTNLHTSVTIPLFLTVASSLLIYVLPSSQVVDSILLSLLQDRWLLHLTKLLSLVLIMALPYYVLQKAGRPFSSKQQHEILELIKNKALAKYDLRINERNKNIEAILNDSAERGFDIPPSFVAANIAGLYAKEFNIFVEILDSYLMEVVSKTNNCLALDNISPFMRDTMLCKSKEFNLLYDRIINDIFSSYGDEHCTCQKNSLSVNMNKIMELFLKKLENDIKLTATT